MRKTKFYAIFGLYDTTALNDGTITTSDNATIGNIDNLKLKKVKQNDYATLEKNFFLLDGSKQIMDSNTSDIGFWSNEMSDGNGLFVTNPKLTITFTSNHSSNGLTFKFLEDAPVEIKISWYTLAGSKIVEETFNPDSIIYSVNKLVENYGKVIIEVTKTNPYRYVKIQQIQYGATLKFGKDADYSIKGAQLVESIDTISDKIATSKLSFSIVDEDHNFNFGNVKGIHSVLQYGQELLAYEEVDNEVILLGKFFLTGFSGSKNITKLTFQDYKGVLADYTFKGGRVYNGVNAGDIIKEIFSASNIEDYEIEDDVYNMPLYGYLKIQDCRKALREILFATGAVIDCSRKDYILIRKPNKQIQTQIKRERKFNTTASTYDYISSVSIKYPLYTKASDISDIYKATYQIGTYTIDFSTPYEFTSISGATFDKYNQHSVTFTVTADSSEVIIKGYAYSKEDVIVTSSIDVVNAGEKKKNTTYQCQVINYDTAKTLSQDILQYLQMRLKLTSKFQLGIEVPSMWVEIENEQKDLFDYLACVEETTIDLTGGFLVNAKFRGYSNIEYNFAYASTVPEIYSGNGALI